MIEGPRPDLAAWAPPGKPRRRLGRIIFWVLVALSAALVVVGIGISAATTRRYTEESAAMETTLRPGDLLLVTLGPDARRGDIIVFRKPATAVSPNTTASAAGIYIKRLIGLPGDHVMCCDLSGRVAVNGKPLNEPYIDLGGAPRQYSFSAVLGPGQIWVLGDYRAMSLDSRAWGPVPASGIIGYASAIEHGASVTRLRTPQTFVADGLAPPDTRSAPYLRALALVPIGILALLILAVVGIIRFAIRRSRARRDRPPGYAPYGPAAR
jgi:signal peptidase I